MLVPAANASAKTLTALNTLVPVNSNTVPYDATFVYNNIITTILPQISSAVQNQDFTVIEDYITGLKALLYIQVAAGLLVPVI